MLYYLIDYLDKNFDLPGTGLFQYISFRAGAAVIISLIISLVFGKTLIKYLKKKQVKESVRDLGLEGQKDKEGTPTMGGLIILAAIVVPVLLFTRLDQVITHSGFPEPEPLSRVEVAKEKRGDHRLLPVPTQSF